jgi:xylulokinase
MSVILSAASCLSWVATLVGAESEAALLAEVEAKDRPNDRLIFLPYLSGERTPHNDPKALGVFSGLSHATDRADLARAVLEGVAFAFADGQQALAEAGAEIRDVSVIGGGARSSLWGRILASTLGISLHYRAGGELGPALGAARLARICLTGEAPADVCRPLPLESVVHPEAELEDHYSERLSAYRRLYESLKGEFR